MAMTFSMKGVSHSPLTGIFLIRSALRRFSEVPTLGHSPLTGIFLIRRRELWKTTHSRGSSQSPDGDFFDPELDAESRRELSVQVTVP